MIFLLNIENDEIRFIKDENKERGDEATAGGGGSAPYHRLIFRISSFKQNMTVRCSKSFKIAPVATLCSYCSKRDKYRILALKSDETICL